jgi:hypothetical protein
MLKIFAVSRQFLAFLASVLASEYVGNHFCALLDWKSCSSFIYQEMSVVEGSLGNQHVRHHCTERKK